jgi:cation diffusion facilitator CzcD-associated flavoprotein CzcO
MPGLKSPELLSKTDILIVGAGPSGLALSAELRSEERRVGKECS